MEDLDTKWWIHNMQKNMISNKLKIIAQMHGSPKVMFYDQTNNNRKMVSKFIRQQKTSIHTWSRIVCTIPLKSKFMAQVYQAKNEDMISQFNSKV